MNLLTEAAALIRGMNIPVETGVFAAIAPDTYCVITPLSDVFELYANNTPHADVQEARISIFTKGGYTSFKNSIVNALLQNGFIITDRRYLGFETGTGYHHYAVDAAKYYEFDMEE